MGPAFLALAWYLAFLSPPTEVPNTPGTRVARSAIDPKPLRVVLHDRAQIRVGPYEYHCNDCHRLFRSAPERQGPLAQHTHIILDHGLNDRCFNCHDRTDRERLVLRNGKLIGFDAVPTLCSQCHGTTFRDWERGMHGKQLGSWSTSTPSRHRLNCTECHDPHHPAYPDFTPLPPPNTLRMGEQAMGHGRVGGKRNPLAQWRPVVEHAPVSPADQEGH